MTDNKYGDPIIPRDDDDAEATMSKLRFSRSSTSSQSPKVSHGMPPLLLQLRVFQVQRNQHTASKLCGGRDIDMKNPRVFYFTQAASFWGSGSTYYRCCCLPGKLQWSLSVVVVAMMSASVFETQVSTVRRLKVTSLDAAIYLAILYTTQLS